MFNWFLIFTLLLQSIPFPGPGRAPTAGVTPVSFTSDTDKTPATAASFTYTSFAVSGTNPLIVVAVAIEGGASGTDATSSVAVSAGLTSGTVVKAVEVNRASGTGEYTNISLWCIPAPSGTGTITVTLTSSRPYQSNALLFANANQTTPCPQNAGDTGSAVGATPNPLVVTLSNLTANDAAVGMGANTGGGDNPAFDQTQTFQNNTSNVNAAGGYRLGSGDVSVTWGTAFTADAVAACRIVPAS